MTRYCDIVMKGGITSGVVYPLAAVRLAEEYRFRNVGGTSAGAIAAAVIAAAEHGKRTGNGRGYAGVAGLPDWLGKNLTSLFQPSRRMRPLFGAMLSGGRGGKFMTALSVADSAPFAAILGMLPGLALIAAGIALDAQAGMRWLAAGCGVLLVVLGLVAGVAASFAWRLRAMPNHYFGICSGNDPGERASSPPLTRWLADKLDELAGKDATQPLTFGDLWGLQEPDGEPGLRLTMITTNLTQGRPYALPFTKGGFWFRVSEFRDLFPARIVDWMVARAGESEHDVDDPDLLPLPEAADLPVVVAARMSLSFPLLISAVPLHAINYARRPVQRNSPERCWFSDGGITSNFPIHFFDSPIPRWPTFAINLLPLPDGRSLDSDEAKNVWMPDDNRSGREERWTIWQGEKPFSQVAAFGGSIFRTAQNWLDNSQMRVHGYRDRIVHVYMDDDEGGMNLHMTDDAITRIANRGAAAAERLRYRFATPPPADVALTWENQRWIRYRNFMQMLEAVAMRLRVGWSHPGTGERTMTQMNERPPRERPPGYPWQNAAQRAFAITATGGFLDLIEEWRESDESFADDGPSPSPIWRALPPL